MNPARIALGLSAAAIAAVTVFIAAWSMSNTPDEVFAGDIAEKIEPAGNGGEVVYTLEQGATAGDIGAKLEELGVIRSGSQFKLLVDLMGVGSELRADTYRLPQGIASASVIYRMTTAVADESISVTLPEGLRYEEMADIVAEQGVGTADEFIAAVEAATAPEAIAAIIPEGQGLQGFLFPDTYFVGADETAGDLVADMLQVSSQKLSAELNARLMSERGITLDEALAESDLDLYEVVTLASIIEREAALASERPLISSVFHNRLEQGMTLGADPTVQYVASLNPENVAEFGYWKPGSELTQAELDDPNPYNTRVNAGLPPGPICNPGFDSIYAALTPADTNYLYFVANNVAADGSHVFAETLEEHERNISLYFNQ